MRTRSARRQCWRHRLAAVALVAALVPVGTMVLPLAPAAADSDFTATAGAIAVETTMEANGAPVTNTPVDGGGPIAQAAFDSVGNSQAFASHPYPGDAVVSAPGTVAGVSGGQITPPEYPLYAASSHPLRPDATVGQPPLSLEAHSTADASRASAGSGLANDSGRVGRVAAEASAGRIADGVRSASSSTVEGFVAGPLRIASAVSSASAVLKPGGDVERQARFSASGINVGDTAVTLTEKGLSVAGTPVGAVDATPIAPVLAQAGITVTYLAPVETATGAISAGVEVRWTRDVPGAITPLTVRYVLGRAAARITGAASGGTPPIDLSAPAASGDGPLTPAEPTDVTVPTDNGTPANLVSTEPATGSPTSIGSGEAGAPPFSTNKTGAVSPSESAPLPRLEAAASSPVPRFDIGVGYLVFVIGGLALAACAALVSRQGVTRPWTS